MGALAITTTLLLVTCLALPSRVFAQTPGQGQALGILLLLGLGPQAAAQPPAEAKKPDGAAKQAARTPAKPAPKASAQLNGRMVVGSVEVPPVSRNSEPAPSPGIGGSSAAPYSSVR
jgi:hypothetical protein